MLDKKERENSEIKKSCGNCGHFCWVRQHCDKQDRDIEIESYDFEKRNKVIIIFKLGENCDDYIKRIQPKFIINKREEVRHIDIKKMSQRQILIFKELKRRSEKWRGQRTKKPQ